MVSLSSEVQPEFREYERFSTTVLNAYLQPIMGEYLTYLEKQLSKQTATAKVGIYQSSGGLMSVETARRFPVRTALSGPAAGAVGAIHTARNSRQPNIITLDMGGTSADVALIRKFEAGLSFDRSVAGFPVRLPMVDIHTVGAGGGSIAWFDRDGLLKVGPASAGADPGPACYGKGGTNATVTDANLVLGRLSPKGLIGGRMRLDREAAHAVIAPIARRLGFSVERTALGIVEIVVANMVRAIRTVSVERGHDPRELLSLAVRRRRSAAFRRSGAQPRHQSHSGANRTRHPLCTGPHRVGPEGRRRPLGARQTRAGIASGDQRTYCRSRQRCAKLVRPGGCQNVAERRLNFPSTCDMSDRISSCRCRSAPPSREGCRGCRASTP